MTHEPVLLDEALAALAVRPGGTYVDATYGAGGHARAILAALAGSGKLIALDSDPAVHGAAEPSSTLSLVRANFRDLASVLGELQTSPIDGILYDLGVSSMQFDRIERGFSLRGDAPLDMRMDPSTGRTALDLLATLSETELADMIFRYGEERAARRIAHALVRRRDEGRLPATTLELARLVSGVVHARGRRERIHPATRTFQALRIAVNDELAALETSLPAAIEALRPGGRIVVISFHSLEDRIVKTAFRSDPRLQRVTKKPVTASAPEVARNPRARSAKLRAAERVAA